MIVGLRRKFLLLVCDIVLVVSIGLTLRALLFPNLPIPKVAIITLLYPPVLYVSGFYEQRRLRFDGMYLAQYAAAGGLVLAGVAIVSYLVPAAALPRRFPLLLITSVALLLPPARFLATAIIGRIHQQTRIIIHGSGPAAEALAQAVSEHEDFRLSDLDTEEPWTGQDPVGFVADVSFGNEDDREELLRLVRQGHRVIDLVNLYERATGRLPTEHLTRQWLLSELQPLRGPAYARVERVRDLVGSVILLLFLALPSLLAALAIWLWDRGPIFYRQARVGLDEREFEIVKLRTMRVGSDQNGPLWTVANDDRITPVGRIVRWLRLDEVPQLLNVLKGEMCLVGPRPEAVGLVRMYEQEIPHYHLRHLVKPGLTGWAQVCFENTSSVQAVKLKLEYDLYYIRHRGLVFDLRIILRTIGVMLSGMGSR